MKFDDIKIDKDMFINKSMQLKMLRHLFPDLIIKSDVVMLWPRPRRGVIYNITWQHVENTDSHEINIPKRIEYSLIKDVLCIASANTNWARSGCRRPIKLHNKEIKKLAASLVGCSSEEAEVILKPYRDRMS